MPEPKSLLNPHLLALGSLPDEPGELLAVAPEEPKSLADLKLMEGL